MLDRRVSTLPREAAMLDAALESMPYGFSIWDDQFRLLLWNRRYAQIYGMDYERIHKGMTLEAICELTIAAGNHSDKTPRQLFEIYRDRLLQNRDPDANSIYEKDIRGRTIKTTYTRAGNLGSVVTHEDITEQRRQFETLKARDEELKRQNMRFEVAVNNISLGFSLFDSEQKLVICNRFYAAMYGLPPELTAPGTPLSEILRHRIGHGIMPVGDQDAYHQHRMAVLASHLPDQHIVELQDGRFVAISQYPTTDGGWVSTHRDITRERENEARIQHLAGHDPLTDLPNRLLFNDHMQLAEARMKRGHQMALLCLDLDRFKSVNDTHGHTTGDAMLEAVAARLRECCRDSATPARLGGDEFAVLLQPLEDVSVAAELADRIVKAMAAPFDVLGNHILAGVSVGIAVAPGDGNDALTLVKNADLALYRAKNEGRGTFHFFEPGMDAAQQERRAIEAGLRQAIARNEFRLVFQPLFNLDENRICSAEALLRWDRPGRGGMSPEDFIPVAEETGLIAPIGEWVLREACATAAGWPDHVRIAVNLSPIQFKKGNLVDQVRSAIADAGIDADRLELEITESLLIADDEQTLNTLYQLRGIGVRISMDDFGTGYSSLSFLRSFPFDKIKIDRSFVHDLTGGEGGLAIIRAVIGLGRSLGMTTTAEGVETVSQLEAVRAEGCTEVQGFLFSVPLPAGALTTLLAKATAGDFRTMARRFAS